MSDNIEEVIFKTFSEIYAKQNDGKQLPELKPDTKLLESGIDSLGFAIIVTKLEIDLGYDPFSISQEAYYPQTFSDFVNFYKENQPPMIFGEIVQENPPDLPVLILPDGTLKFKDIIDSEKIPSTNTIVGIFTSDVGEAVKILVALDGRVNGFVFFSPALEEPVLEKLANLANVDFLLIDKHKSISSHSLSGICVSNLDTLKSRIRLKEKCEIKSTRWTLTTSGTTGTPKLVEHNLNSLTKTSKLNTSIGKNYRWGLLYDFSRYAGLQVLLQSVLGGSVLIAPDSTWPLPEKLNFFAKHNITNLSATPALWRKILMSSDAARMGLLNITLGGEIADDKVLGLLKSRFQSAKIRHIYASTEAGVGFSVTDGKSGFPVQFLEDSGQDVKLKVVDGQLFVKNSNVFGSYVGMSEPFADEENWVATGDTVEIRDERVYFLGRASGVINVGGDKVHPETLEQILTEFPAIIGAHVYAKNNPFTGQLVVADVIIAKYVENQDQEIRRIEMELQQKFPKYMVPAIFRLVDSIEETHSGKIKRG